MTHFIIENLYCMTGVSEARRQLRVTPATLPPGRFLFCCCLATDRLPFLKLRFQQGGVAVPAGRASSSEYLRIAADIGLSPQWKNTPPPDCYACCLLQHPDRDSLTLDIAVDTNDAEFVRMGRSMHVPGFSLTVSAYLLAAADGAGDLAEEFPIRISFTPAKDVPGFRGAVGLDLGNHNSAVAGYERGRTDEPTLIREGGLGENASVDPAAPAVPSVVKIHSILNARPTDSLNSIEWEIGDLAMQDASLSLEGIELAAKKLIFSPRFQQERYYTVLNGPSAQKVSAPVPLRLPGELLACRLLQQFREATRTFPKQLAVSYPTMYAEREVLRLREVIHRAWLRLQGKPQDDAAMAAVRSAFNGPARMTEADEGVLLMLDEASAAAFFFLFQRLLDNPGQLGKFRYLYPQGLNLLLFDCGGGTTDIALVRALVRPADPRNLVVTVRGRVGSRDFGGHFITECVFRLLKAKAASILSETTEFRIPPPPSGDQTTAEQLREYFSKYRDQIDKLIPTRSPRRSENELPHEYSDAMKRAMKLWRLADEIKIKLAASASGNVTVEKEKWRTLALPNLTAESIAQRMRDVQISRRDIDRLIEQPLQKLVSVCNELIMQKLIRKQFTGISEENQEPEDVHWVVVAGAASRYPLVRKVLQEQLKVPFLNAQDETFRESRMTFDEGNLKHAVAKGLARVLLTKDLQHGMQVTFDSQLAQRLPYDVIYRDSEGKKNVVFRENTHVESMTDPRELIPSESVSPRNPTENDERQARHVMLYRRFPGESSPTPFLEFRFHQGVGRKISVRYDVEGFGNAQDSPFIMVNNETGEQGTCTDLTPEESFLHPVQRGDL